jgi:signal transduction histidine kinase
MTTFSKTTQELQAIVTQINYKKELLADIKASDEKIEKLNALIKESQEEIKALLQANVDYFTIEQEKKGLEKELKQGAKSATENTPIKPADYVLYLQALSKEDGVAKVVAKGFAFRSLENM